MPRQVARILLVAALAASGSAVCSAHHSISAVYDDKQRVSFEAVITEFRFVSPHPYLVVSVSDAGGSPVTWHLELDNRSELAGLGMTAESLHPGDRISVTASRSRTERRSGYVRKLVRPADGFEYEQVGFSPRIRHR
jgi:hypothetical protein